jgi:hypothetical protein
VGDRGFKAILKKDRKEYGGGANPAVDECHTGSDLQVLVNEHIEALA